MRNQRKFACLEAPEQEERRNDRKNCDMSGEKCPGQKSIGYRFSMGDESLQMRTEEMHDCARLQRLFAYENGT